MNTGIFDKNNTEILVSDTIKYSDLEHNIVNELGEVRYNGLANTFEVINSDIQSGNNLLNVTNVEKWQ